MSLAAAVKRRAEELGFLACGITDPSPIDDGGGLDHWLAGGYAGVMRYLHRQARKRKDPRLIIPGAKSVVVVLDNYYNGDSDPGPPPKVARYARGQDYHRVTRERLEPIKQAVGAFGGRAAMLADGSVVATLAGRSITTCPSRKGYRRSEMCASQKCPRQSEHSVRGCGPQSSMPHSPAAFRAATRSR